MIIQKYQFQLIPILIYSVFHRFKMIYFDIQIQRWVIKAVMMTVHFQETSIYVLKWPCLFKTVYF